MPRTETTVANDITRLLGKAEKFEASWSIRVPRPGWHAEINISVTRWDFKFDPKPTKGDLTIHVFAFACIEGEDSSRNWHYSSLMGTTAPRRLTRKWIMNVLREGIETARLALMAVTEADLQTLDSRRLNLDDDRSYEERVRECWSTQDYFVSTLDAMR